MAFSALKKSDGNYEIFQDGQRIATGMSSILGNYGLSENYLGSSNALPTGTPTPTTGGYIGMYGNDTVDQNKERFARSELGSTGQPGEFQAAASAGIVDPSYINEVLNNPLKIAGYVNALAYGGYTLGDILNDLKRGEMAWKGNKTADSMVLISPTVKKDQYVTSPEGNSAYIQAKTSIPTFNLSGQLDPNVLQYGINIPPQIFKQLVPILDPTSQAFQDAVAAVGHQFYDLTSAQLNATTAEDKATADYNYNTWKTNLEDQYNITLSNNAAQAWTQIQNLDKTYGERGIQGSGLESGEVDAGLKNTRRIDANNRTQLGKTELAQQLITLKSTGSPDEIKQFLTNNPEMSAQFRPDSTLASQYDVPTLTQKLFDNAKAAGQPISMEDATKKAQMLHDTVLDANGNFVSDLNKTNNTNQYKMIYGDPTPDVSQLSAARTKVTSDALASEEGAYSAYDNSHPYSQATTQENTQMKNDAGPIIATPTKTQTPNTQVQTTATNISNSLNNPPVNSTSTQPTKSSVYGPAYSGPITSNQTTTSPYVIKYGDTLGAIAAKNKTTVTALAKLNNISDPNKIQAGATLKFQ